MTRKPITAPRARNRGRIVVLAAVLAVAAYVFVVPSSPPEVDLATLPDRAAPRFALPPIEGYESDGFSTADLKAGRISVVNAFASWCIPCLKEHRYIKRLADMKIADVYGINYKDDPAQAGRWLRDLGDSYTATGADRDGRVGLAWGIFGVPATFIVDGNGHIRYRHFGAITAKTLEDEIVPIIRALAGKE